MLTIQEVIQVTPPAPNIVGNRYHPIDGSDQSLNTPDYCYQQMNDAPLRAPNTPAPFGSFTLESLSFDGAVIGQAGSQSYKSRRRRMRGASTSTLGPVIRERSVKPARSRQAGGDSEGLSAFFNKGFDIEYKADILDPGVSNRGLDCSGTSTQDVREFVCPVRFCIKAFKRLEHLKRHVLTHTRQRPYACHHCARCFSRSDNLQQHMRTHDAPGSSSGEPIMLASCGSLPMAFAPVEHYRSSSAAPGMYGTMEDPFSIHIRYGSLSIVVSTADS
jgi:hypothetical protein